MSIPPGMDLGGLLRTYGYRPLSMEIGVHENTLRALAARRHRRRPWKLLYKIAGAKGWRVVLDGFSPSVEDLNELWERCSPE